MSKGKVDVSFIKHVATSDDFQREVIDHNHGKDNLLVGASRQTCSQERERILPYHHEDRTKRLAGALGARGTASLPVQL